MATRTLPAAATLALAACTSIVADDFELGDHVFTVPEGFVVERAAGPPLVDRPITADFDELGRLYVADSAGVNTDVQKQLAEKPHRIVRLVDADGDGVFDHSDVFADRMMFPEGTLWYDGSLYVAAPPSIWKLTDTDGDGVSDQREEWFQGKTLTGCANDLHGPYLGPDGWIYWAKGAFARQTYERPGRPPFVTRAAHIFRCLPLGARETVEPVMTGGMDNPVDVVFTPGGERIITTTFFQHPGGGKRDGLIHAIYGGVYGKRHDVIEEHPRTGDILPVLTHLGPAAPCGLERYSSTAFGEEYRNDLFAALFNLQKVTRHALEPAGATFRSHDSDFLVSSNRDFHPTDVFEDADGSLLVIDTGGWYKLCCPSSQLHKPEVLGAIYRVRRRGASRPGDPRGLELDWTAAPTEIVARLGDRRYAVCERAVAELARRGEEAVAALRDLLETSANTAARRNAVWALTRIDSSGAREVSRIALGDADPSVRQAAAHSASVRRDRGALPRLLELLRDDSAPLRRSAAEALGRLEEAAAVPALLEAAAHAPDRILEHSLTYALIEIAAPEPTAIGLKADSAATRRTALIALDQMRGGNLRPETVVPYLSSKDETLRDAASWIVERHPDWGGALAGFLRDRLAATTGSESAGSADSAELERLLARFAADGAVQQLLAESLDGDAKDTAQPKSAQRIALGAISQARVKEAPASWTRGIVELLEGDDPELRDTAVAAARRISVTKGIGDALTRALLKVARDSSVSVPVRLEALAAVPGGLPEVDAALLALLLESVEPATPVAIRSTAVGVLTAAKLTAEQKLALLDIVKSAGPLELPRLLSIYENLDDTGVAAQVVAALNESTGLSGIYPDRLEEWIGKLPESLRDDGARLLAALDRDGDVEEQRALVDKLAEAVKKGDPRRGQAVFNSEKAACSSCHAIGYLGGTVGPDLTKIGQIRSERDLIEAVLFPSASFVRSYEPVTAITRDGQVHNGVMRNDTTTEITLLTGPGETVRIARDRILQLRPGKVSVMPAGLDKQLSREELADLIAFLKATRWR